MGGDILGTILEVWKELADPGTEFSPAPFWFLNDDLQEPELCRQLEDFKSKGVDAVILHPRIGIPKTLRYLSDEYFAIIRTIVETAAGLDMSIILYDEAMYPSGSAHGEVVRGNPEFASCGIALEQGDPKNGKVLVRFDDGFCIVQRPSGGTIRGIHYGEDDGEPDAPPSADLLNPKAVAKFIHLTHDRYYEELSEYFGTVIRGFFTDEPCVLGRCGRGLLEWTDGFERDFTAAGGKLEDLRGLFSGQDKEEGRFFYKGKAIFFNPRFVGEENPSIALYRRMIVERLNSSYYSQLSDWCRAHGIALMGHPKASDDIDEEFYFDVPGQDLVFRRVSPEEGGLHGVDSVQAKCSADAARHTGKRRNSNECFGVCNKNDIPWYLTAGDIKWFLDWMGVRGVNLFIPHAFYYSVRGERSGERPPDVGPNNIWWPWFRQFSDYIKRISWLMTDSVNGARVMIPCSSGHMPVEQVIPFYESQVEFNYVPESLLPQAEYRDGCLWIGGYGYRYWLGDHDLDLPIPRISSIAEIAPADRDLLTDRPCPDLRVSHLKKLGADLYFLTNEGNDPIRHTVSVPVTGTPARADLWKYSYDTPPFTVRDGRTDLPIEIPARGSLLLLFGKPGDLPPMSSPEKAFLPGIAERMVLVSHDKDSLQKTYRAVFHLDQVSGREAVRFEAEEIAECRCNGTSAGVSLWGPHEFIIGPLLHAGENVLELTVTGSLANRYGGAEIPYGLFPNGVPAN